MRLAILLLIIAALISCSKPLIAPHPVNLTEYVGTQKNAEIVHTTEVDVLLTRAMGVSKNELVDLLSSPRAKVVQTCDNHIDKIYYQNTADPDWCILLTGPKGAMLSIAYINNWRGPHMEVEASLVHSPEPETWSTYNESFGGGCGVCTFLKTRFARHIKGGCTSVVYIEHTDNLSLEDEIQVSEGNSCNSEPRH